MYRLAVVAGPNKGTIYPVNEGEISIGRQGGNVITLPSAKVSKKHCVVVANGDELIVRDVGSSNGTFVNGVLVKTRRVSRGDKISVGDYVLEVKQSQPQAVVSASVPQVNNVIQFPTAPGVPLAGAQAAPSAPQAPAAPKDLRSRVIFLFENRLMPIFYGLVLKYEWRMVAIGVAAGIVIWNLIVSVQPLIQSKEMLLMKESAKRARFIARQIVDLNSAAIAAKAETRTTVGRIAQEPEVRIAYLVDLDGRIIAPSDRMNQLLTADAEAAAVVRARQLYRSSSGPGFQMAYGPVMVGVEPLEIFDGQMGKNVVSAIAVVSIDTRYASGEMSEVSMIYSKTLVMMGILSCLLFLVLYRMTLKPFEVLNEDIDKVLKGEMEQVTRDFKFTEMNQLWDVINSALQRIPKDSGMGGLGGGGGSEIDISAENYMGAAKSLGGVQGLAVALLDGNGAVQFFNGMFEEITGLRFDNVAGQPLANVARDQAFGSFVTDVIERTATGTDGISEDFEFSGVTYKIRVGAFGPVGGKGRSFLMVAMKSD
jgi:hypothetical protein